MTQPLPPRSERNLQGVHPDLIRVVRRAFSIVTEKHDTLAFVVTEGLRTQMRQAELLKAGASQTMNSRHLTGHAVDLAATVAGDVRWDWPLYFKLAQCMRLAAIEYKTWIVWGGVWDRKLNELNANIETEVAAYTARRRARGAKAFLDGPHYELSREHYG